MKTKEELNNKLNELTEDELKFVTGGVYKKDISSDKEFADSENNKTKINFANAA